jgi:hypothetical protein
MYDLLLKNVRNLVFLTITLITYSISFGQICPLNTPEFPFTTDYDDYGWSSGLYMPSQLGGAQSMTSVSFRIDNDDSGGNYTYNDIRVYVRHTAVNNFASDPGYPGTAGFTQVYSGNMTFNGTGMYTFNFNVAPSFVYNGSDQLEVLFENRGNTDNTWEEPWFDRTNATVAGIFPGKVGWGGSWLGATGTSSNRQFNLALQFTNAGDICAFPLPVKLSYSSLTCDNTGITINWETASEKNNDYFTISFSEDGKNWRPITTIDGAGNSANSIFYKETLNIQSNLVSYYRLSQTDFDGTSEVLNTFAANCGETNVLKSYPNPALDKVYLSSSETLVDAEIEMYDLKGQKQIITFSSTSKNSGEIDIDHFASGVYTLRVATMNLQEVIKVVKR